MGIMPLDDAPWERAKCGYKPIQYMACSVAVVASPVGVNCEIVQEGMNGHLAATAEEWYSVLERLICNPRDRQIMGKESRKLVEEKYSVQVQSEILKQIIVDIGSGSH